MAVKLVAEVKTESPFGFKSEYSWHELFDLACEYGDIISIHVNSRWGGSPALIDKARSLTDKPILAKGLDIKCAEVHQYLQRGANHVLVHDIDVSCRFEPGICWVELPTLASNRVFDYLDTFSRNQTYVVNARDPRLGHSDENHQRVWEYVRRLHRGFLVQASLVETWSDVKNGANAVIVGQHLRKFLSNPDS